MHTPISRIVDLLDPSLNVLHNMDVDEARARAAGKVSEHGGRSWYFCSDGCRDRFAASPGRFATAGEGPAQAGHGHGPASLQARAEVTP